MDAREMVEHAARLDREERERRIQEENAPIVNLLAAILVELRVSNGQARDWTQRIVEREFLS